MKQTNRPPWRGKERGERNRVFDGRRMETDGRRSPITAGVYDYVIVCTVGPGQVRTTTHGTRLGGTLVILAPVRLAYCVRTYRLGPLNRHGQLDACARLKPPVGADKERSRRHDKRQLFGRLNQRGRDNNDNNNDIK